MTIDTVLKISMVVFMVVASGAMMALAMAVYNDFQNQEK